MDKPKPKFSVVHYSALTVSFLSISSIADSQTLYVDIEPDLQVNEGPFAWVELDVDMDGNIDFNFGFQSNYYYWENLAYFVIDPVGSCEIPYNMETEVVVISDCFWSSLSQTYSLAVRTTPVFAIGDTINSALDFSNETAYVYKRRRADCSCDCSATYSFGVNAILERIVGFRLWNSGEPYYGWIRFKEGYGSLGEDDFRHMKIMDYGIQQEPFTPVTAGCGLFYEDMDGDGFGVGEPVFACDGEGVGNNADCDDTMWLYSDADGDGFGAGVPVACGVPDNTDCDDTIWFYADADGDGFGAGAPVACGVPDNTDCDDTMWLYTDADGDGFGAGAPVACGVPDNTDCDDSIWLYTDADGDSFGAGTPVACGVPDNTDCDDAMWMYADGDGDGFGAGDLIPCDGVENNIDCDDTMWLYADADGDGFGTGSPVWCGVPDNTDCNDYDAFVHAPILYYQDADGDGYGNADGAELICDLSPFGYVVNSADCDDQNAAINIDVTEILNGIDDNCNGEIDEGLVGINTIVQTVFKIYPNPTNGEIIIEILNGLPKEKHITITDALQKVVLKVNTIENKITLDTQYLASGMYYIRIETDAGFGLQNFVKE